MYRMCWQGFAGCARMAASTGSGLSIYRLALTPKGMSEDSALVRGVDAAWMPGMWSWWQREIMVQPRTITTPGISRKVITVGCADDDREVEVAGSRMVDYSGRGPTDACICKPDIVAPGSADCEL